MFMSRGKSPVKEVNDWAPSFFLGIDDMFVIMQSLDNLKSDEKKTNNIPQNIGQTMTHAGVAITVTSITDIVVFAVGSSTVRIILKNFFREINFIKSVNLDYVLRSFKVI